MQQMTDRAPAIVPLSFWKDYDPQPDGTMRENVWVEWTRKGTRNATTKEKIARLKKDAGPIWQALVPYYEHWKKGQDAPIDGTPLAVWPGATQALVKALEPYHMCSVEDLAKLSDGEMARVQVPGMRAFRDNARAFIEAQQTTAVVAGQMAEKDRQIEFLTTELAEIKALLASMSDGDDAEEDAPAPRKRKRKQD